MYVKDEKRGNAIEYSVINGMIKNQSLSVDAFIKLREKNIYVLKRAELGDDTKYQKYDFVVDKVNFYNTGDYASMYKKGGEELAAFDRAYEVIKGKDALKALKEARFEYVQDKPELQTTGEKAAMKLDSAKEVVKGKFTAIFAKKEPRIIPHDPRTQPKPHIVSSDPAEMEKALEAKVAKAPEQPAADLATAVQPTTSVAAGTSATGDVSKPTTAEVRPGWAGVNAGVAIKALLAAKKKTAEQAHKAILEEGPKSEQGGKADKVKAEKVVKAGKGPEVS